MNRKLFSEVRSHQNRLPNSLQVSVQLKPAPIPVVVHPVIGVGENKKPLDHVQVALVCVDKKTGETSREEAEQVLNNGDPYIVKSAAPLDDSLRCEVEVSGEGLITQREGINANLGDKRVPVYVQVNQRMHNLLFTVYA